MARLTSRFASVIGLPASARDGLCKVISAPIEQGGDLLEDIVSGMRRKLPHRCSRTARGCDSLLDIGLVRLRDLGDEFPGERINDRSRELAGLPLAMHEKRTGFLHGKARWGL